MRFLFLFFCSVVFFAPVAQAQNTQSLEDMLGLQSGPITFETLAHFEAHFKQSCRGEENAFLERSALNRFCRCAARNIPEHVSLEQANHIYQDTAEGQFQRLMLLSNVYLPCLERALKRSFEEQCTESSNSQNTMTNIEKTCECIAENVAKDMVSFAPAEIEKNIDHKVSDFKPLDFLLDSKTYQNRWRYHHRVCTQNHELRLRR